MLSPEWKASVDCLLWRAAFPPLKCCRRATDPHPLRTYHVHARLDHLTVSLPHPTFTQPVLSHLWQVWSASATCADPVFSRCLWLMKSPRRSQTREPIRLPCFASSCHENSTKAMWKVWEVLESMVKKKAVVLVPP